jgi:putative tricarboxylic transport membrane protein
MGLVVLALPLTRLALSFGPPEFFALMVVGLSLVTGLASRSLLRAIIAAILGLLLTQVGIDPVMGAPRFAFGRMELLDGFGIVPVVMGLFGVGEILSNAEAAMQVFEKVGSLVFPGRISRSRPGDRAGHGNGIFLGLIRDRTDSRSCPTRSKQLPRPRAVQDGMIGRLWTETANNSYANAALIPLFT